MNKNNFISDIKVELDKAFEQLSKFKEKLNDLEIENEEFHKLVHANNGLRIFSIKKEKELEKNDEKCKIMEIKMLQMKEDFEEKMKELEREKRLIRKFLSQMSELCS